MFGFSMLMHSLLVSFPQNDSVFCKDVDVVHLEESVEHASLLNRCFRAFLDDCL